MFVPVFLVMTLLVFYPLGRGIYLSFTNADQFNLGGKGPAVLLHASRSRQLPDYPRERRVQVPWRGSRSSGRSRTSSSTSRSGLILALVLNRTLRLRGMYRLLLLIPLGGPVFHLGLHVPVPLQLALRVLRRRSSRSWAMDPEQVPAFLERFWAKFSVIAVNVWLGVPFMMVALLGGLQSIPSELYEAAEVDGATAVAALPAHHAARAAPGLHHGGPALHHLDLQHVPGDLPADPRRARRSDPDPGHPGLQILLRVTARFGARRLGRADPLVLMLFAEFYRRVLRTQGDWSTSRRRRPALRRRRRGPRRPRRAAALAVASSLALHLT